MIWAAISDIKYYIISNKLCLSVTFLYPVYIISLFINNTPLTLQYIGYSIGIALILFLILTAMFAFNLIGGGDVKLIPAISLWAGPALTLKFLYITAICGGIVSLCMILFIYLKSHKKNKSSEKINLSMSEYPEINTTGRKIPYGVAIATGGIFIALNLHQAL